MKGSVLVSSDQGRAPTFHSSYFLDRVYMFSYAEKYERTK